MCAYAISFVFRRVQKYAQDFLYVLVSVCHAQQCYPHSQSGIGGKGKRQQQRKDLYLEHCP